MKTLACAVLILAGCTEDPSPSPRIPVRTLPDPAEVCAGNCCWGMHQYQPPATCLECGAGGCATLHVYCAGCAKKLGRCPHCGRVKRPKEPAAKKEPTPPDREPDPPPPPPRREKAPEPPPTVPPPPPKEPEPKAEGKQDLKKLPIEEASLGVEARKSHSVIVFAADAGHAFSALETHRTHKQADIDKLPVPAAGNDPGLYLVWGDFPEPTLKPGDLKATYDEKARAIRVAVPPMPGRKRGKGIGMDWGVGKDLTWEFVGFRVKLTDLPAGDYSFEVVEVEGTQERPLSAGKFTLDVKK